MNGTTTTPVSHDDTIVIALAITLGFICVLVLFGIGVFYSTRTAPRCFNFLCLRCCPQDYTRLELAQMQEQIQERAS